MSISLTAGHPESRQTQTTTSVSNSNSGSAPTTGSNLSISAMGGGQDSNLTVLGSGLIGQRRHPAQG